MVNNMTHKIDMVMDLQYGSTGKGLIAGYLARRNKYDTAVCAFSANAGHTYIDSSRLLHVMTQQLPTAITSPTVRNVLIGPGAAIDLPTLEGELNRYADHMRNKQLMIHPQACFIRPEHVDFEVSDGRTKMGSTAKGVGEAYIERMRRGPKANVMRNLDEIPGWARQFVVSEEIYAATLCLSENTLIEGAQGFSLSMYHGQYPYVTSRDVTPWQIAADCALPFKWAPYIQVIGTLRTFPIRVNNRDGSSGPCYADQREIEWADIGLVPELTTVTKLPRRIFTFSQFQLNEALHHCGGYWSTKLFLNFCNYLSTADVIALKKEIERPSSRRLNPPTIEWFGFGSDDANVISREKFEEKYANELV